MRMLLTTAKAAQLLNVGVSSVKRWTDEGELESVRTPGGHRRYTASELRRFASLRGLKLDRLPQTSDRDLLPAPAGVALLRALVEGNERDVRRLVIPPSKGVASRAAFLDRVVGDALREIGRRWKGGSLSVDEEHRASHLITEAVDALRPPARRVARLAVLACPPGEHHELPLRLVRLVLEWSGWRTELLGASLPWDAAEAAVTRTRPWLIAFSSRDGEPYRFRDFERFIEFCKARHVRVIVGGEWARGGTGAVDGYHRFRTLRGFERWLRTGA